MEGTDSQDDESDIKRGSDDSYCMVSPEEEMDTRTSDTFSVEQTSKEGVSLHTIHEVEPGGDIRMVDTLRSSKSGSETDRDRPKGAIVQAVPSTSRRSDDTINATPAPENALSSQASWVRTISSGPSGFISPQSTRAKPLLSEDDTTSGKQRVGLPVDDLQSFTRSKSASLGGRKVRSDRKIRPSTFLSGVSASLIEAADCKDNAVVSQQQLSLRSCDTLKSPTQTCRESTKNEAELSSQHQLAMPTQESERTHSSPPYTFICGRPDSKPISELLTVLVVSHSCIYIDTLQLQNG